MGIKMSFKSQLCAAILTLGCSSLTANAMVATKFLTHFCVTFSLSVTEGVNSFFTHKLVVLFILLF